MIRHIVCVNKYNWLVIFLFNVGAGDIKSVIQHLRYIYANNEIIKSVINNINSGENCAITITNRNLQKSVISFNKTSSIKELVNSIVHECRHVESHIADKYNIDEKGESVAYMIGELVSDIYERISNSQFPLRAYFN